MHAAVLRYFEAVAEAGSIRRASERLHISPSAVDRQILKIEDFFGTPLFERRPNGMRLTDAGQLVLRHARETLHDFARLRPTARRHRQPMISCVSRSFEP